MLILKFVVDLIQLIKITDEVMNFVHYAMHGIIIGSLFSCLQIGFQSFIVNVQLFVEKGLFDLYSKLITDFNFCWELCFMTGNLHCMLIS